MFEENKRLKQQLSNGSKAFIETSKSAAQIELESAEKKFKAAYEAGDADALTTAQKEIARATMKVDKAQGMRPVELDKEDKFQPPSARMPSSPKSAPEPKNGLIPTAIGLEVMTK